MKYLKLRKFLLCCKWFIKVWHSSFVLAVVKSVCSVNVCICKSTTPYVSQVQVACCQPLPTWLCNVLADAVHYSCTQWTAEGSVFGVVSLWFFVCVWNVSGTAEQFVPNSHGRRVFSLLRRVRRSRSKVKCQGHQGQKTAFFGPFDGLRVVYVW